MPSIGRRFRRSRAGRSSGDARPGLLHSLMDRSGVSFSGLRNNPAMPYYLLIIAISILLVIGYATVFSVSSLATIRDAAFKGNRADPLSDFRKQLIIGLVGYGSMLLVSLLPRRFFTSLWVLIPGALFSLVLQTLTIVGPLKHPVDGNESWIKVPGLSTMQPAEFLKLGLCLVVGMALPMIGKRYRSWGGLVVILYVLVGLGLVAKGRDLGTVLAIVLMLACMLWIAGIPLKVFGSLAFLGGLAVTFATVSSANRLGRIDSWLDPDAEDPAGLTYQPTHARYALGTGGWTGTGPGESRQKWGFLTQADTDFIFAIVGEEYGLVGTLVLILMYAVIGWCCLRIIKESTSRVAQVTVAGFLGWFVGQALINMNVATGLFPVLGVPLPLVSRGGSSALAVLVGCGVLLNYARNLPGAREAMRARGAAVRRTFSVVASERTSHD